MENLPIPVTDKQHKIAQATKVFSGEEIAIIKNTVAKDTTDMELTYFLMMANSLGLNPFNKEIWCYKQSGQLMIFAGRDGFLTAAQKNPKFKGLRSAYVCKNDQFELDIPNNQIIHKITSADRGEIVGAYAIAFSKDAEPGIVWVDFKTYNKGYNAWKSHPGEMIVKVAEVHVLKKTFGLSGLDSAEDFDFDKGTFRSQEPPKQIAPVDPAQLNTEADILRAVSLGQVTKDQAKDMIANLKQQEAA